MTAIDLLKDQHDEVDELFKKLEECDDDNERKVLFDELARDLVAHDTIEREIFYPTCEKYLGLIDILAEALVEHGLVEFCLYQLDRAGGTKTFRAKLTVLKEVVKHHVHEEEHELFPKVKHEIDADVLKDLGAQLEKRFEQVKAKDFRDGLYDTLSQVMGGALKTRAGKTPSAKGRNGSAATR